MDAERIAKLPIPDERRKSRHDLLISLGPIQEKQLEKLREKKLEEEKSLLPFTPNSHRNSASTIKSIPEKVYERLHKDAENRQINAIEFEQQINNLITPKNDPNFAGGRPPEFFKLDSSLLKISTTTDLIYSNHPALSPRKLNQNKPVPINSSVASEIILKSREVQKNAKELEECSFRPTISLMNRSQSARKEIRGETISVSRSRSALKEREKLNNFWEDRSKQILNSYDERMKKEKVMGRSASAQPLKHYQTPLLRDIRHEITYETRPEIEFKRLTPASSKKAVPVEVINIRDKPKVILLVDVNLSHNKSARISMYYYFINEKRGFRALQSKL